MKAVILSISLLSLLTASNYKPNADLETAKQIISLQDSLLRDACEHSAEQHDCDCPWADSDKPILINELKSRL